MSCAPYDLIPSPPTSTASCAVPIGGSNSSILDACCNGHINAITTYDADNNSEDGDGCFQYCVTQTPDIVQSCLAQQLAPYEHDNGVQQFACFNVNVGKSGQRSVGGYSSAGSRSINASKVVVWGVVLVRVFLGAL